MVSQQVALYVRVSSQEQIEGYSLDAQERAGRAYAEAHGWEVTAIYRDEGRSARTDDVGKRPAFGQMLADAERGVFTVLIVHKLDRFARNLRMTLEMLERLERSHVAFVSISEQMDFSTPIGKVILATLAAFAQYYSDNLSTETRKGKAERKQQGLWNGLLPYGTTVGRAGLPILDTREWACNLDTGATLSHGAGLQLAFQLAAAGHSDRDIARRLTAHGYRTTGNRGANPFTKDAVRVILRNHFYIGELPDDDGGTVPGRHHPIIAPERFADVQHRRVAARTGIQSKTAKRSPWALSGVGRCAGCGAVLRANGRYARCPTRIQGGACQQPSARIDQVVEQVGNGLAMFTNLVDADYRYYERLVRLAITSEDRSVVARRGGLERRRIRLQELYLEGDIAKPAYLQERNAIDAELATMPDDAPVEPAQVRSRIDTLSDIATLWHAASPHQQNVLARQVFASVTIDHGEIVSIVPQPVYRPFYKENPAPNGTGSVLLRKRRDSNPRSQP